MAVFPGSLIPKVQLALFCKQSVETVNHFLLECSGFKENLDFLWDKLKTKPRHLNPVHGDQIVDFITNLDQHYEMLLLLGGLQLPFKIRTEKLHELGAP